MLTNQNTFLQNSLSLKSVCKNIRIFLWWA
nr:MAG TPA: hypothetical protein [Caudoviricetes sp.]